MMNTKNHLDELGDFSDKSVVIDGVRYITLQFLLDAEKIWPSEKDVRQKDRDDIKLMEHYLKQSTIDAYNGNAKQLAKKFDEIGVRTTSINEAFSAVKKINPKVLEIGCGNGRDAEEIVKRTNDYLGMDISEKMIDLAQKKVPDGRFQVADIESFVFPNGLDIVFAFASLLHVSKESLKGILERSFSALNTGGIVYLSLKYKPTYEEFIKQDEFGERTFYFYSPKNIEEVAGGFTIVKNELFDFKGVRWLEVMLRK